MQVEATLTNPISFEGRGSKEIKCYYAVTWNEITKNPKLWSDECEIKLWSKVGFPKPSTDTYVEFLNTINVDYKDPDQWKKLFKNYLKEFLEEKSNLLNQIN